MDPTVQRKWRQSLFKLRFQRTSHISIWTSEIACRIHCEISKTDIKFERKHIQVDGSLKKRRRHLAANGKNRRTQNRKVQDTSLK